MWFWVIDILLNSKKLVKNLKSRARMNSDAKNCRLASKPLRQP